MSGGIKNLLKRLAGDMVGEYRINWIYAGSRADSGDSDVRMQQIGPPLRAMLGQSATLQMRKAARYGESGLLGMALVEGGVPVCAAHFAQPQQYDRDSTWPLQPGEAALMDIATEEHERGKGHAVSLIRSATASLVQAGQHRLIAFIWWSNHPSLRAFEKAGWHRIGLSIEIRRARGWSSLKIPWPRARGH